MLALVEFDASLLSKTCYHADSAVVVFAVIFIKFQSVVLVVFLDALFVKARQTRLLVFEAFAPMPTR